MPYTFETLPFNANSLAFSAYNDSLLAVTSSQNFGLVGNGRLHILNLSPKGINAVNSFDTQDGLYDCAWSEVHENQLVTASGDGTIKLFDITLKDFPIKNWKEHSREVFSVHWSPTDKETFVSASWDTSLKIVSPLYPRAHVQWHPNRGNSVMTLKGHAGCVYAALYSPHTPNIIASCSADSTLKTWDTRQSKQTQSLQAHPHAEVLSLDWNKYTPLTIHTSSNDRTIKTFDLRSPSLPLSTLQGHTLAVRKIATCPHDGRLLASASYDMTTRIWDWQGNARQAQPQPQPQPQGQGGKGREIARFDGHTEFAYGVEWSLFGEGWVGSVGWDGRVFVSDWKREWKKV